MPQLSAKELKAIRAFMRGGKARSAKFFAADLRRVKKAKKIRRKIKRLMTLPQKKALIKAIGKNKSMKPSSRKAAIRKIRAKKTRKS